MNDAILKSQRLFQEACPNFTLDRYLEEKNAEANAENETREEDLRMKIEAGRYKMTEIEILCDDLKCNIVAKRHCSTGKWDVRISHPWYGQPLLTSANQDSFNEAMTDLNSRIQKLEGMRLGIERRNKDRDAKFAKDDWCGRF